jgi:hypothetical protein
MSELIAGKNFPWEYIAGYYLRVHSFMPFAKVAGEQIGPAMLGAYGLLKAELPNPDVQSDQRILTLPVEDKSDFKSIFRAHLDSGVKEGTNELVVMFENRKGFFGGRKSSFHVAAYPAGTWKGFFDAVSNSTSDQFRWPKALFLYQPSSTVAFPAATNIFSPA